MSEKMKTFREGIPSRVLPYCLSVTLVLTVMSVYGPGIGLNTTVLKACLLVLLYYPLAAFTEKHHRIGGALITIIVFILYLNVLRLQWIGYRENGIMFQQWALTAGTDAEDGSMFLTALWISATAFFALTVYYFAVVLYRVSFLMLISLLPCVLYAKVMTDVEDIYVLLIAALNVALFLLHRQKDRKDMKGDSRFALVLGAGFYIFVLFFLGAFLPKQKEAKYYDRFEDLFLGGDTRTEVDSNFAKLSSFSGNADNFRQIGNRRLYRITGNQPPYLKRQTFDLYDFRRDRWYGDEQLQEYNRTEEDWFVESSALSWQNLQQIYRTVEKYIPGFGDKYGLSRLIEGEDIRDGGGYIRIQSLNFGAVYLLTTTRSYKIIPEDESSYYISAAGAARRSDGVHPKDYVYDLYYYDELGSRNEWIVRGGAGLTGGDSIDMFLEIVDVLEENGDPLYENALNWLYYHLQAREYSTVCAENTGLISEELKALAHEITDGYATPVEKAQALQDYFHNSGFVYDLEYYSRDTSPEYFVFESKRGTCSDYASAYVLMARSVGLTVRYAEGYAPDYSSREGVSYIKDSTSHAYPEVFIPGMGWTVFEPTVASEIYMDNEESENPFATFFKKLSMDFGMVEKVLLLGVAFVVCIVIWRIILPALQELYFRISLHCLKPEKSVVRAYGRIRNHMKARLRINADSMTPGEVADYLAERQIDVRPLTQSLERILYDEKSAGKEERAIAVTYYRLYRRSIIRRKK